MTSVILMPFCPGSLQIGTYLHCLIEFSTFRLIDDNMALKTTSAASQNERNEFGRKMYLVLCLQRGLLDEALKTALKIQENIPNDATIKELISCIPQRMRQLEAATSNEDDETSDASNNSETDTDDGFGSYSSDSSSSSDEE